MGKGRLEAFTDGVIAIIITIMVLELKVPHGADFAALWETAPVFLAYVLSFINVGIFWDNHHHMLHATKHVDGRGLELSQIDVNACVARGLPVVQGDADTDLVDYPSSVFDVVILSDPIQVAEACALERERLL